MLPVLPKRTESMTTRDGIRLDADVYVPDAPGKFPVLLMRQPYGRAIASTVTYAHPQWYAAHGYIVVIQDVRGRGTSEGDFDLFAHEVNDGVDAVNWVSDLSKSTGQVGMYGFSYQGMTQIFAAAGQPSALKTICPAMAALDLYADWAYEGGAFCLFSNQAWALQLAAESARRQDNGEVYKTLYTAAHRVSPVDPVDARLGLLSQCAPDSFYHDWLQHSDPQDPYWQRRSPATYLENLDLPMLHIGSWFDPHLRGTIKLYEAMKNRSRHSQQLWIGPWAHLPWGRKVGSVDFGVEANSPMDQVQIRWFDLILKEMDRGLLDQPPVHLFEMGRNRWRTFAQFPNNAVESLYLHSNGLAGIDLDAGAIASEPDTNPHPDIWVHDPWRPVPALGGHAMVPAGPGDRTAIDCRSDVLTYTSPPLSQDLHLAGISTVELYCEADAPSFDLCAVLSEVQSTGEVLSITQGYRRVDFPSESGCYTLSLHPTCYRLLRGSSLRLSLSAACFPAYSVNPGTGQPSGQGDLLQAQVITLRLYRDGDRPSRLQLPTVSPPPVVRTV
jgi:putative CocE/NonD family hydrolase